MRRLSQRIAVCLMLAAAPAGAQVVRGAVTDRISAQPLAGVLVSIEDGRDSLGVVVRNTLTDEHGNFALTLPSPGRFRLSAKRIGVARFISPVFDLHAGETRRIDVPLDPVATSLPPVRIEHSNLCLSNSDQRRAIAALWDEISTALIATEISRREQRVIGWLSKYTRVLDPRTLRIFQEHRTVAQGHYDNPLRGVSADSLASFGYWGKLGEDTLVFYGPDAETLLADAFRYGHCFLKVDGFGRTRGLIGLAFRPREVRLMGGIQGTIWIDARNLELRFVEFRYTNLITIPNNPHLGGEVHFQPHPSGAWMVSRWLLRMPRFPEVTSLPRERNGYQPRLQPIVHRIVEEGGSLFAPGLRSWERPGTIVGIVTDSGGRAPLAGTIVSLSGTPYSVEVDARGGFRFDSIPPGAYTLLASQAGYAVLGQLVDDEPLTLAAGQTVRARLTARTTSELLQGLCGEKLVLPREATVVVLALHAETGEPLPRLPVWLRWPAGRPPADSGGSGSALSAPSTRVAGIESMTDGLGVVTFCGVPSDVELELVMLRSDDDVMPNASRVVRVTSWVLKPGEITSRTISARPPR